MKKQFQKEEIKELLLSNIEAVERGIVRIFKLQTNQERNMENTILSNGVGFSGAHVSLGTYLAKWILKNKHNHLTGKFIAKGRNLILHYTKQLTKVANDEIPLEIYN